MRFWKHFRNFSKEGFVNQKRYMEEEDCNRYLSEISLAKLDDSDKQKLGEPITQSELGATLHKMRNGTSPGSDGFTVEFYKFFLVRP